MRSGLLWVVAVVVTVGLAVWQRLSGPTYPVRGTVRVGGAEVKVMLARSGETGQELPVAVAAPASVQGEVAWRRFPTDDPWNVQPLERRDGVLHGAIPSQPPAGKVEVQLRLTDLAGTTVIFPEKPAVARFKAAVPGSLLLPHILAMFLAMAVATRAGLAALAGEARLQRYAWTTFALLGVGGFLLGPAVQKFAFGAWWTGVPFGWDLTDNKTLLAGMAWVWALWRLRQGSAARLSVLLATVVMLVVFSIPHSVWGSQLDWRQIPSAAPGAPTEDR